jgi:hypothetical protein
MAYLKVSSEMMVHEAEKKVRKRRNWNSDSIARVSSLPANPPIGCCLLRKCCAKPPIRRAFYVVIRGMPERAVFNYGRLEIIKEWGKGK